MGDNDQGSMLAGLITALLLMLVLGLFYFVYALIAGVIAGVVARRTSKGTFGALVGSGIVAAVIVLLSAYEYSAVTSFITKNLGAGQYVTLLVSLMTTYNHLTVTAAIITSAVNLIIPAMAGGFIGGALVGRIYTNENAPVVEVSKTLPAKTQPAAPDQEKQLQRLKKMKESGTISNEEYENLRKRFTGDR
ncbi:MAG: SHOCT domain-containing protein [Thermoplasmataceae archaeon]